MTQPHAFVVDDDENLGQAFKMALELCGFKVTQITDSTQALAQIIAHKPDVVLLDMQMPMLSGAEVLQTIRATPEVAHTKVIVASANHLMLDHAIQDMANLVLQKPVSLSQIIDFARRMVKSPPASNSSTVDPAAST